MTPPSITAVIPTHNRPDFMRAAVESVVGQEYAGDIEIIVVFDACEPILPNVILPGNRSLLALRNERTRGLAGARNSGIVMATHELVAFLDDDDEWFPHKVKRQVALFESFPDTLLVGSGMLVTSEKRSYERLLPFDIVRFDDLIQNRLAGLHSSSFLFRRSALLGAPGLIDEKLPASYGEDYDILLRTSAISPIRLVNEPLVSVRWSGQSYFFGKWLTYADGLKYLLDKHPEFGNDKKSLSRIESQIAFSLAAGGRSKSARQHAGAALSLNPLNIKALLAWAVGSHLLRASWVVAVAQRLGKGI